jgi:hypothetical protein
MVWSKATPSVLDNASRSALANTFERWWRPISTTLVFAIGWFWYVRFCTENRTGRQRAYRIVPYSLLALKSIMGLNLLAFAHSRQAGMDQREREDRINDFGRKPIGDSLQEQVGFDCRIPSQLFANPGRFCSARNTMIRSRTTCPGKRTTCPSSRRTRRKTLRNLAEAVAVEENRSGSWKRLKDGP